MEMTVENLRTGYAAVVDMVHERGKVVAPRGRETLEVLDFHLTVLDPRDALPLGVGRGVSKAVAAVEAAQLIAGVSVPKLVLAVAPQFEQFTNDGELRGAYGPRIAGGLFRTVRKLYEEPDTRQAVVSIWKDKDPEPGSRDVPCTLNLQWMVRDGKLVAFTTMRSNDVWLGLPYDAFMFTQLQLTLASCLGIPAGAYHHSARSFHLYTDDLTRLHKLRPADMGPVLEVQNGFEPCGGHNSAVWNWEEATMRAKLVLTNQVVTRAPVDWWYREQLKGAF